MSSAPGWRELRWFAACAVCAALFNLVNAPFNTSSASPHVVIVANRLNLFFAGLHGVAWLKYVAASEKRPSSRAETTWIALGLVCALMTLLPGVIIQDRIVERRVAFLDIVYRDAVLTKLGFGALVVYEVTLAVLFVRSVVRWWQGDTRVRAHAIALGAVTLGGAHDGLATAGVLQGPYVLDLALVVMVLAVGGSITTSFVGSARALEVSSKQLAAAQAELVNKERLAALGELAAVVAHEVRNPLAVVFNATAGLRRERVLPGDHDALVSIIQEEAERLRDLVSDLLEFARPRPAVLDDTLIGDIVRGAIDTARSVVGVAEREVAVDIAVGVDRVICDERLVRQAVVNLVTNALQAEARRSPVRVTLRLAADSDSVLVIEVVDDGRGVADDVRDRIFTPFFSTRPKGTGLGLAIVQRCAEAHHGTIRLRSTPGGGATFELSIPRRRA